MSELKIITLKTPKTLERENRAVLNIIKKINIEFIFYEANSHSTFKTKALITSNITDPLVLSMNFLKQVNAKINFENKKLEVHKIQIPLISNNNIETETN